MNSPEIHPAALLFPMMEEEELRQLSADIEVNGLMEPVILYCGQVLDGRNRLAACELANVKPQFIEMSPESIPSPSLYVLSRNLHRRHLTVSQRAAIAAEMLPLLQEEARKRQRAGTKVDLTANMQQGTVAKIAADAVHVGERIVYDAAKIKREHPEIHERVKNGEITINEAAGRQPTDRERQKAKAEVRQSTPCEPQTNRQKQLANGQKERMVRALSTITGLCRGLQGMDIRKAVSACDDEERQTWIERAKELSSQLRTFAGKLRKGF